MKRRRALALGVLALAFLVATGLAAAKTQGGNKAPTAGAAPADSCQLQSAKGDIKHVIYVIFDNVHFLRDNPNVPSDLEQMPHLLDFMRGSGSLLTNHHTILISHTANGILTSFTGLYPDRHGQAVANSYRYFKRQRDDGLLVVFQVLDRPRRRHGIPPADPLPNMVNGDSGSPKTTPAPWVPYTRAGCDFGAVASANIVLENTGTGPNGDMTKVFGQGSAGMERGRGVERGPAWNRGAVRSRRPTSSEWRSTAQRGGGICTGNPKARPDLLPDEPGGYNGFLGLFGTKYVNPCSPAAPS